MWGQRNAVSRWFHAKDDKKMIATWRLDLDQTLQVFNVRSVVWVKTSVNFSLPERTRNEQRWGRSYHPP